PPATSSSPSPRPRWRRRSKKSCRSWAVEETVMKIDHADGSVPASSLRVPALHEFASGGASPEVFQRLGELTRQLHDALNQLGYMPRLQDTAEQLPDARSRLTYIAHKTEQAAEKVLNLV